ncbi:MAG: 3-phosphoshikimate 1-carboxyvinyltransferase [Candidatus Bathyarchaeota archaeon]|nr:3-phosphoshikimate 1-carboxyvinyltransferase [Candidatus Bathyarchaeota archaeon]
MRIKPATLHGTVKAPPSKSMTHRLLITSALADGVSLIQNPLHSQDTEATAEALRGLGTSIREADGDWGVMGGTIYQPDSALDCHESGTTLRLLTGVSSIINEPVTLSGVPQLQKRPNKPLLEALEQLGVKTKSKGGYPPITVKGRIRGGKTSIRGDVSSQFISAIMLAAPYAENPVDLQVSTRLESKPYVEMTIEVMKKAGIKPQCNADLTEIHIPNGRYIPQRTHVEGDWSSAAYMLAAGALGGKVHVDNLNLESKQADREIINILEAMEAYIKISGNRVTTELSRLSAVDVDLSDCPDLFPMVACLCAFAEGTSNLSGLGRLRLKESDRLTAMTTGLKRMGIDVTVDETTAQIKGGTPKGAVIDTYNDHRIAMSFAVLAQTAVGETVIQNPECVDKSYPEFWQDLRNIGAKLA